MANSHLKVMTRLRQQAAGWKDQAPGEDFAGLSLKKFNSMVDGLAKARLDNVKKAAELRASVKHRLDLERLAMAASKRVISAMRGDPKHGEDSPLIRACGFVTESERKSGLTRKRLNSSDPKAES